MSYIEIQGVLMKAKLKKLFQILFSYIPTALPVTDADYEAWAADILSLAGYPRNDSLDFALSTMVLHSKSGVYRVSKQSFVSQVKRAAANQAAGNRMQQLKDKQREERELQKATGQVVQEIS